MKPIKQCDQQLFFFLRSLTQMMEEEIFYHPLLLLLTADNYIKWLNFLLSLSLHQGRLCTSGRGTPLAEAIQLLGVRNDPDLSLALPLWPLPTDTMDNKHNK